MFLDQGYEKCNELWNKIKEQNYVDDVFINLKYNNPKGKLLELFQKHNLNLPVFNTEKIIVDTKDSKLEEVIESVVSRFGGDFQIETGVKWQKVVRNWDGIIVHLTMYGEHIDDVIDKIKKNSKVNLLIIVGSEKVPRDVYDMADYNVAIGHQPHSEVAALAVFLDRYFEGMELKKDFNGKLKVLGTAKGKKVIEK